VLRANVSDPSICVVDACHNANKPMRAYKTITTVGSTLLVETAPTMQALIASLPYKSKIETVLE
jgi:hypothetical protein